MIDKIIEPHNQAAALATGRSIACDSDTPPMILFECPCGKHIAAPMCSAGHKGYCPKCKSGIIIPRPRDKSVKAIVCSCGYEIVPRRHISHCPQCNRSLAVSGKITTNHLVLAILIVAALAAITYFVFLA